MEEGDGGGFGDGGDPGDQFHRNEAISAVADEGFIGEEDDDYEDLYNDVNVGEGFLQSLRKNEDLGFRNEVEENKIDPAVPSVPPTLPPAAGMSIPGVGGDVGGGAERKFEKDVAVGVSEGGARVSVRLEGYQSVGYRGNEMGVKGPGGASQGGATVGGGGMRVQLGQSSIKTSDFEEQTVNNTVGVQGIVQQQPHGGGVGSVGNEGLARQGGGNVNGNTGGYVVGQYFLLEIYIGGQRMLSLRQSYVSMGW